MAEKTTETKVSTKAPLIYKAISDVMNDIGAVGKDSKNVQQGFMFRGIDAVMNAIHPALAKHHIFVVPRVIDIVEEARPTAKGGVQYFCRLTVEHDYITEDGSMITSRVVGLGADSGDKGYNKAMSIALKYSLFEVFCIPTEEMKEDDPDGHTPEESAPQYVDEMKQKALLSLAQRKGKEFTNDVTKLTLSDWKKYMDALEKMPDAEKKEVDLGL